LVAIKQTGKGKGNALACGFWAATGDIIVMLDADGSTDPAEIPRFVAALLVGADFATGSRFIAGGGSADITTMRRIGNWGLAKVVNSLWGGQYSDLCYGYNAFWRRCLPFVTPDCEGFEVETLRTSAPRVLAYAFTRCQVSNMTGGTAPATSALAGTGCGSCGP
jgi:glycosyltransferase involved in cell wall biosynthesis